jgi:hypothetical protein
VKHLRALLVLLHVLAVSVMAFPAPVGAMSKKDWASPELQQTFQGYAGALRAVGLPVTDEGLQAWLWEAGNDLLAVRKAALAPFRPYLELTGSEQGWRMFGTVNRRPAWLVVEVGDGQDQWRRVYEMRSDEHTWLREQMDQERVRGLVNGYSWLNRKKSYDQLSVWLARRASVDFPDASHMRIAMERRRLPAPQELRTQGMPAPTRHWETRYSLDKYR